MLISVVGNASSILDKNDGALIDSAALVIRLTYGVPISKRSQGRRTDIVVTSARHKRNYPVFEGVNTYWWTAHSPERAHLTEVLGYQPSNGIVALEMVKNRYPEADVQVFGFDWKATPTFYHKNEPVVTECPKGWFSVHDKHNYAAEKEYCLRLIDNRGWTLC